MQNRKTKTSASWIKMVAQLSQSLGLVKKIKTPDTMVAIKNKIVHNFLLFILSIISIEG
jgi:hypothetical protein